MSQNMNPRQITVAEMAPHVHSFGIDENKVNKISDWLINWIRVSLKSGKIKPRDFLPSKGDLACHIGVSKGTMQNVFRYVEDFGLVASKQKIGTYIKDSADKHVSEKLTSKREIAVEAIKKHIKEFGYNCGDCLMSTRKLSKVLGISAATVRIAVNSLISEKIIKKLNNAFVVENLEFDTEDITAQTLVEKIATNLKNYIARNYKQGDKLPTNQELAGVFEVSVKTIHDAIKLLSKEGILSSKRGKYGTLVINSDLENNFYYYEKVELKIKHFISEKCEIGTKLPSILEFSKIYDVSPKTIKKALDNLAEDGFLTFSRGRYGGTFVTDIPQSVNEAYKWLAISSEFCQNLS